VFSRIELRLGGIFFSEIYIVSRDVIIEALGPRRGSLVKMQWIVPDFSIGSLYGTQARGSSPFNMRIRCSL
jgi:hypothetical protein